MRMYETLKFRAYQNIHIPKERTVYHVIEKIGLAIKVYPTIKGAVIHSVRGVQYTSEEYWRKLHRFNIIQSMNSDSGRFHDIVRCENMWAGMRTELLYDRYDTEQITTEKLKAIICRYIMEILA